MHRSIFAIWICAVVACSMLGGGVGGICVSSGEDPCGTIAYDECCPGLGETSFPPSPDDDSCCVDVFPPTMAEPVLPRMATPHGLEVIDADRADSAMLPIPPPRQDLARLSGNEHRGDAGPPRDIDEIVRTARLLL